MIVFGATATGYVAFATFLVNQAIFLAILGCCLYLIDVIVQDGTAALLRPEAEVGGPLRALFGLRRNVLAQIAVVVQGVARLVLIVIAAAAVLEPWGVQSQDWFSSLRAAYFGFAVGGVTLSLSSMLEAAVVFGVALFATRLVQSWLSDRLLPETRFDPGVSNSISTIFGYVGGAVAVLLAASQIGLDMQRLAIVAGALSVGIGFGLQSIANNFVSGLILLWERSIRVGDLVVVGADQGFVRRINARATEIETFDRATLIVPNSNFVTNVVKNWVHTDRIGRIIVAINVAYESDVEAVRAILIDAAKAHDLVLSIPAPIVLLRRVQRLGAEVQSRLLRRRGRDGAAHPKRHQFRHPAPPARGPHPHPLPDAAAGPDVVRAERARPLRSAGADPPGLPADDRLLARQAPVVAGQRARAAEHAMTGDDEGDRVAPDRRADRARGLGPADLQGDVGIGGRPSHRH